uniref:Uncharacterized protein n=1 Tax=Romanomermis culicivorax TaxID=13658 RepID=A0A915IME0_ROMCU
MCRTVESTPEASMREIPPRCRKIENELHYHIWPLGVVSEIRLLYWKALASRDKTGSYLVQ